MVVMLLFLMFFFLVLNFPMVIPMVAAPLAVVYNYILNMDMAMTCQQLIAGCFINCSSFSSYVYFSC